MPNSTHNMNPLWWFHIPLKDREPRYRMLIRVHLQPSPSVSAWMFPVSYLPRNPTIIVIHHPHHFPGALSGVGPVWSTFSSLPHLIAPVAHWSTHYTNANWRMYTDYPKSENNSWAMIPTQIFLQSPEDGAPIVAKFFTMRENCPQVMWM